MTQWYRRHVNAWFAMAAADGQRWNYGASPRMVLTPTGTAATSREAFRSADALVPLHTCSTENCGEWHEVTLSDEEAVS